jgi:class 3 adenylate cyclase/tetratricopeptide (TPR) repeat protein
VLFVDLTNFTATSRSLESEEVFAWIDSTLKALSAVINRYEGAIDKFTGDGLMALFGMPQTHENDPERAVRAALDMQAAIQPLRDQVHSRYGIDFQMRIGMNTGPVIAGSLGDDWHTEYTVLGDTVNLASRLEHAAQPGTVLVSATTYARTAPLFEYEALPPMLIKGLADPIQTYRPHRPAAVAGNLRGLAGRSAPMIGRSRELHSLRELFEQTSRSHRNHTVMIDGAAGLGKSRLIAELRRELAPQQIRFFQVAGLAHNQLTPFYLAASFLRSLLQIAGSDPLPVQQEQVLRYLQQAHVPAHLHGFLLHALSLPTGDVATTARLDYLDPAMLQRQTHAAIRQVVLSETGRGPLVLVFDDLHWIDQSSRDFLEYLLETSADVPLLAILISRDFAAVPGLPALQEAAGRAGSPPIRITLQALSPDEGRRLVDLLLHQPDSPEQELAARIIERAAGNPFYIEEFIRMLIEEGGLREQDQRLVATDKAVDLLASVPVSLRELILARFDRLEAGLKRLLHYAAVAGRMFPGRILEMAGVGSNDQVAAQLQELVVRNFLMTRPFDQETGYGFQHALVQDAIYATLLRRDRQDIHERLAETIERGHFWPPEEQAEVLAHHYAESSKPVLAIPLLMAAAENAARRYAHDGAIQHYRRCIDLMRAHPADYNLAVFQVRVGLGRALKFAGQYGEARRVLDEARNRLQLATIEPASWLNVMVDVLEELADLRLREGALEGAAGHLEAGLTILREHGADQEQAGWHLLNRLAFVRLRQGDIDQAFALAGQVNAEAAEQQDPITLASLYGTLGGALFQQGQLAEAASYVERSLAIYQSLGYQLGTANAYANLGVLYYAQGLWSRAVENLARANELRREIGYMPEQAVTLANLGLVRLAMGEHDQAAAELAASLVISERIGDGYGILRAQIGLAHLALIRADYPEAARLLTATHQHIAAAGEDESIQIDWLTALLRAHSGSLDEGRRLAERALATARGAGLAEQEAECLRVLGQICVLDNQPDPAEQRFQEAIDLCRRRDDPYQRGLALLELGRLYLTRESHPQHSRSELQTLAHAALSGAAGIFEQLGAGHDMVQARRLLAELPPGSAGRRGPAALNITDFA